MMTKPNKFGEYRITTSATIFIPVSTVELYAVADDYEKEKIVGEIEQKYIEQVEMEKDHFRRQILLDVLHGEYNET